MLEYFVVASEGGLIYWSHQLKPAHHPVLNDLLHKICIEGYKSKSHLVIDAFEFKWSFKPSYRLVFIAAYHKLLRPAYVAELLEQVNEAFCDAYETELIGQPDLDLRAFASFDKKFASILRYLEEANSSSGGPSKSKLTKSSLAVPKMTGSTTSLDNEADDEKGNSSTQLIDSTEEVDDLTPLDTVQKKMAGMKVGGKGKKGAKSADKASADASSLSKPGKVGRTWAGQVSKADAAALDFGDESSDTLPQTTVPGLPLLRPASSEVPELAIKMQYDRLERDTGSMSDNEDSDSPVVRRKEPASEGRFFSFFKSLTGQQPLGHEDLILPMKQMREHLISKNVAADITDQICQAVEASLVGQCPGTFVSVAQMIRDSTERFVRQVLTPPSGSDLFTEMSDAVAHKEPYVISFIGVNGVGKSTNLAKVCFWSLQKQLKVLIAACDTFRSGAVEQLRKHVDRLSGLGVGQVALFERGYGKDAAAIAKDAIAHGKANGFDVILIDTAGRMQDNEPLMRALAKLVGVNQPHKVVFVGEALVGNEAMDQLAKFNRALTDYCPEGCSRRKIDGIILTKFDTIDDKVGAALSMTYTSGAPILFVGTGQTYMDLKRMNVKSVVDALLRA